MELLDHGYLNDLVLKAQRGSSNAFAELFAATYQRQYAYSCRNLQDARMAKEALRETFVRALKGISGLQNPELFIAWLGRINFRVCYEIRWKQRQQNGGGGRRNLRGEAGPGDEILEIDKKKYLLRQVMNLPLAESQAILMRYYQNMSIGEIGDAMNIKGSTVGRYLRSGKRHLQKMVF